MTRMKKEKKGKSNKNEEWTGTFSELMKEVENAIRNKEHFRIKYIPPEKQVILFELSAKSKNPLENGFILFLGLAGLRQGTIAHTKESWVDYTEKTIRVPRHDPCCCTYCYGRLKKRMKRFDDSEKYNDKLTDEIVKKYQFRPKTVNGARTFYYGHLEGFDNILHQFFKKNKKLSLSVTTVRRRIKNLYKRAGLEGYIFHDLRSTSATDAAKLGLNAHELNAIYGWKNSQMADTYVQMSNRSGVDAMKKSARNKNAKSIPVSSPLIWYPTPTLRKLLARRKKSDDIQWLHKVLFEKNQVNKELTSC